MPSLREKLQQEKAAKTEAKERDAVVAKEKELATLRERFDSLLSKRTALSEIQEAAAKATAGITDTKKNLKAERQNLRSLHAESVADEDVEDLPRPAELVRGEVFQETEEVQSYIRAREAFRLSAATAKEVQDQLTELGIPDSNKLLPGQLELMLEEREKELNEEVQSFILEHPDVNPEMAAQVREEVVTAKAAAIRGNGLNLYMSNTSNIFEESLKTNRGNPLDAIHKAVGIFEKSGSDKTEALTALTKTVSKPEMLNELDEEALSRAIVRAIASDFLFNETGYGSIDSHVARRGKVLEALRDLRNEEIPEELYTDKDGERVLDDERVMHYYVSMLGGESPVREAAQGIIRNYKKLAEYREIPKEVRELETRKKEVESRLKELKPLEAYKVRSAGYSSSDNEMARVQRADDVFARELEEYDKQVATLRQSPGVVLKLRDELPREIHNLSISVGEWTTLGSEELRADRERLEEEDSKDLQRIQELSYQIAAIEYESNGLFGRRKENKQNRLKPLREENRKLVEQRQQRENEMRGLSSKYSRYEKRIREATGPYRSILAGHGFKKGTVSDLFTALREAATEGIRSAEAAKAAIMDERKGSAGALAALEEERKAFESELGRIEDEIRTKESNRTRLKSEIEGAGYRIG